MRIDVKAFAIACGMVWGFGILVGTWWVIAFEGITRDPTALALIYRGYSISPSGSAIGMCWGLVDGALGGAVLAVVYNALRR